jgi:hypothetical protein
VQCPRSHTRACLQSLSEAQFVGSTCAQAATPSANHHSAAHGPPLATDVRMARKTTKQSARPQAPRRLLLGHPGW